MTVFNVLIHIDSFTGMFKLFTDVYQGQSPILDAEVNAVVSDPSYVVTIVNLYDTGTGTVWIYPT